MNIANTQSSSILDTSEHIWQLKIKRDADIVIAIVIAIQETFLKDNLKF